MPAEAQQFPGVAGWEGTVEFLVDVFQDVLAGGDSHAEDGEGSVLILESVARVFGIGGWSWGSGACIQIGDVGDKCRGQEGLGENRRVGQ